MLALRTLLMLTLLLGASACDRQGARRDARASPVIERTPHSDFSAPDAQGWGRAGALRYLERTLGGGDPQKPLPLVVMIHGLGDAPRFDWFRGASAMRTPMRLIMPEAPTPYSGGFAWFPFRSRGMDMGELARGISAAADKLAHSIAVLRARRPTLGRAIVTGFSQGGMLSYALALHHPELVDFSHPISGLLPEPLWPQKKPQGHAPRIAAMHGDRDDVVPIEPARQLRAHVVERGYDMTLREFPGVGHEITEAMNEYTVELLEAAARAARDP